MAVFKLSPFIVFSIFSYVCFTSAAHADRYLAMGAYKAKEYEIAEAEFAKLYAKGDAEAAFALGLLHFNGWGVPKSEETAEKYMNEAVKRGWAEASAFLCQRIFDSAIAAADFGKVIKTCWLAASETKGPPHGSLTIDPVYRYRSRFLTGIAFDKQGDQWYADLCYTSAYIFLHDRPDGQYATSYIRDRFFEFGIKGWLGVKPSGKMPGYTEKVPPCMTSRAVFAKTAPMIALDETVRRSGFGNE